MHKTVWEAWAPPKVKFFAWLANPKIEIRWQIGWRSRDGQIVGFALFSSNVWNPLIIYLLIAVSPLAFGGSVRSG
jgi:hypothetical protein